MEEAWQNVDGFYALMYQLCQCRRNIVASLLKGDAVEHELLVSLEKVRNKIVTAVKGDFVLTLTADNGKSMHLNVKDELLGIEKDLCFLGCMKSGSSGSKYFVDCLARYHPKSVETFHEEVADWDGTMKTYCSNYRTSVQPVYSAYWLSGFAKLCGSLCAVLTAGPLGDFGILNLVAVPVEQTNVIFGGSWGREWLINNHRHVDRTAVTENGEEHLNKLTQCLLKLIHERTDFHRFLMTGSGFQRKVDRITIGFQTVSGEVTDQERTAFLDAVMTAVRTIDADDKIFSVRHEKLDIEVVLRTVQGCWTKGDGVRYLLKETGKSLAADVVWMLRLSIHVTRYAAQSLQTWLPIITRSSAVLKFFTRQWKASCVKMAYEQFRDSNCLPTWLQRLKFIVGQRRGANASLSACILPMSSFFAPS